MNCQHYFHVAEAEDAKEIIRHGFLGGWGDTGFGVYFYSKLCNAKAYARHGGWDQRLECSVVIRATVRPGDVWHIEVNPEWPNPEDYEDVYWHEMDQEAENTPWRPLAVEIIAGPFKIKRKKRK